MTIMGFMVTTFPSKKKKESAIKNGLIAFGVVFLIGIILNFPINQVLMFSAILGGIVWILKNQTD